jgi:WD40 repeat protein
MDETVMVWDTWSGETAGLFSPGQDEARGVAFSPNGRYAVGEGDGIAIYDLQSAKTVEMHQTRGLGYVFLPGYSHGPPCVAFSPDSSCLLTAHPRTVRLWSLPTGKEVRRFDGHAHATCVAFSPDGRTILSGGKDGLCLWEVASGRRLLHLREHTAEVHSAAFSVCGTRVVSGAGEYVVEDGKCVYQDGKPLRRDCTVRLRHIPATAQSRAHRT